MSTIRLPFFLKMQWLLIPLLAMVWTQEAQGQCTNPSAFGTITAPTNNTTTTITTCAFGGEYSTINSCSAGSTYLFNATGGAGNYITIHQGTPGGTVLGFGFAPISVLCTVSGPLYLHYNTNAACGTDGSCHTGTIQCTSCPGAADPCSTVSTLSCGTAVSATVSGAGLWSPGSCGFSTPGMEKIYSFTPTTTGVHQLQVNSTSSTGFIDYFYKAASGGCNSTGWICIDDIFSPFTATIGTLTAGTTYYILLDAETTSSVTQNFQIVCPAAYDPCASVPTLLCSTPVTTTPSGSGVWSPGNCGFSTPGQEKVYAFTPTSTGAHSLQVNSVSGGYIDYFYKAASGGCNSTGWTCIDDINFTGTFPIGTLTAGTTYYILADPEGTGAYAHNFQIVCPSAAPPCVPNPTSPTNAQTNICPSTTQTLSWPAAAGATSYDVYFGTSATPPFVGNTAATSFVATTPTNGLYYWQIRPVGPGGTAAGCTIWSFTKQDITLPTITCPANITVNNSPATACSAVATYGSVSATDNCSAPSITLISGLPSGSTFPVGTTTNTWRATDAAGNTRTCTHTIRVNDVTLPTITCPANINKSNDPGLCGSVTAYPAPTASDNCSGVTVMFVSGLSSGSTFPVGTTLVTYKATDASSNSKTCTFTVKVNDTEKPTIACPDDLDLANSPGMCGAANPALGYSTSHDNCGIGAVSNNGGGFYSIGSNVVTWTVTDLSGNTGTCQQTITVKDEEWPTITCPQTVHVLTDEGTCGAIVDFAAQASDNCPGSILDYSYQPLSSFDLGFTEVTASITDAEGHWASCIFIIQVDPQEELCNGVDDDCDGLVDEAQDWEKVLKHLASDGASADEYGGSVDISSVWAIAGAAEKTGNGAAYLLFHQPSGWAEVQKLTAPTSAGGDQFGASVAIDVSGIAAVGAPGDDEGGPNAGAVYVFHWADLDDVSAWTLIKKIIPADANPGDQFGSHIALTGDVLLVGKPNDDDMGQNAGAAYLFGRNTGGLDNWGQVSKMLASDGVSGDNFGSSVATDGQTAVVGAPLQDSKGTDAGAVYFFDRNQGGPENWGAVIKRVAKQGLPGDHFGIAVAVDSFYAVVGAPLSDMSGMDAGAALVFGKNTGGASNWGQQSLIVNPNGAADDHFGQSVGIDDNYIVAGAPGDSPFGEHSGSAFTFLKVETGWMLVGQLTDGGGAEGDQLASAVAMDSWTVIAGAPSDQNGNNLSQGSVQFFEGLCGKVAFRPAGKRDGQMQDLSVQVYPVPFNETLTIQVNSTAAEIRVSVLNALGQEVANWNEGQAFEEGRYEWQAGKRSPGLYFVRVQAGNEVITKPVILSRN